MKRTTGTHIARGTGLALVLALAWFSTQALAPVSLSDQEPKGQRIAALDGIEDVAWLGNDVPVKIAQKSVPLTNALGTLQCVSRDGYLVFLKRDQELVSFVPLQGRAPRPPLSLQKCALPGRLEEWGEGMCGEGYSPYAFSSADSVVVRLRLFENKPFSLWIKRLLNLPTAHREYWEVFYDGRPPRRLFSVKVGQYLEATYLNYFSLSPDGKRMIYWQDEKAYLYTMPSPGLPSPQRAISPAAPPLTLFPPSLASSLGTHPPAPESAPPFGKSLASSLRRGSDKVFPINPSSPRGTRDEGKRVAVSAAGRWNAGGWRAGEMVKTHCIFSVPLGFLRVSLVYP